MDSSHDGLASRRQFLSGLAALGAGTVLPACQSVAPAPERSTPFRIDVHHHLAPPGFIREITARKTEQRPLMEWTPAQSIAANVKELMELGFSAGDLRAIYRDNARGLLPRLAA